ncbi:hypothetical protein CDS [Bradyrhizobium sp.]|uniref:hypothetical protein n=1 Tax=Bradyrhizobium sp. TaxID=376 RepID=UPI0007C1CCAF|nr:hypothetical protein [Bradyrhizobium sp.]CUU16254.1 hypothetical protein CDS [Bradyrhizobium sp.]
MTEAAIFVGMWRPVEGSQLRNDLQKADLPAPLTHPTGPIILTAMFETVFAARRQKGPFPGDAT